MKNSKNHTGYLPFPNRHLTFCDRLLRCSKRDLVNLLNMVPKMIQAFQPYLFAFRMLTQEPAGPLSFLQMLVIKVVVPDRGSRIFKRPLLQGKSLIAETIWALCPI